MCFWNNLKEKKACNVFTIHELLEYDMLSDYMWSLVKFLRENYVYSAFVLCISLRKPLYPSLPYMNMRNPCPFCRYTCNIITPG